MTDTEKYYTPDLSEFHIGFEYEQGSYSKTRQALLGTVILPFDIWTDKVADDSLLPYNVNQLIAGKAIRVRSLSHDDIVGCGWSGDGGASGGIFNAAGIHSYNIVCSGMGLGFTNYGGKNTYKLATMGHPNLIQITDNAGTPIFHGTILNKSELKFQMKRLGITT